MKDIKINKINFLIHPGYFYEYSTQAESTYGDDELDELPEIKEKSETLLDKYVEKAKSLGESELLFIFLPSSPKKLKKHLSDGDTFARRLKEIKGILGRRAITITDPNYNVPFGNDNEQYEKVKKIAEARGYVFDKNVETEAFGETLGTCVEQGAERLNEAGNLSQKTLIRPELTDGPLEVNDEYDEKRHKSEMTQHYKRIKY